VKAKGEPGELEPPRVQQEQEQEQEQQQQQEQEQEQEEQDLRVHQDVAEEAGPPWRAGSPAAPSPPANSI
jgi:hypothetical protein